jgi:succinyl-diaminopimelate desuccinylase
MTSTPLSLQHQALVKLCRELVAIPSENPPGSTAAIADFLELRLHHPNIAVKRVEPRPGIVNLVATLKGGLPGKRVVLNGHLDTFPVGPMEAWSHPPLGGQLHDGRIHGRGAGDMKAGVALLVTVMLALAQAPESLHGELVLLLVGDEETGGKWGTSYLLQHEPAARGDVVLNADAGNPMVVRIGEKGIIWFKLISTGRACHGAHVHLGDNALESLMASLSDVVKLRDVQVPLPAGVMAAMVAAKTVSESVGGIGEFDNLSRITVNVGAIHGGTSPNLVPGEAHALVDMRYPPGLTGADVGKLLANVLGRHPKVRFEAIESSETEPSMTEPAEPLVQMFLKHARHLVSPDVVANMRVGLTDARLFRHVNIPTVVYGPTAYNMGGVDEYVEVAELTQVFDVHLAVVQELLS